MTPRWARTLAWSVYGTALLAAVAGNVFLFLGERPVVENFVFGLIFMTMGFVGALIASRKPENAIGWILLGATFMIALSFAADEYALYSIREAPLPADRWVGWLGSWGWVLAVSPLVTVLFLLFPDGHSPSKRWRPVLWACWLLIALVSLFSMVDPTLDMRGDLTNPIGIESAGDVLGFAVGVGFLALTLLAFVCAASLIVRFRGADGEERKQIQWLAYAGVLVAISLFLSTLGEWANVPWLVDSIYTTVLSAIGFLSIPLAIGISLLRYRLYEIDVVISKTVVVAVLASFVTAVYLAIVVGIGTAVGTSGEPNLVLSIVATAVIALAFQPLRVRARRLADRVVYGKRASPYEVLSDFSERMAGAISTEDVLPRMARILGEGTGATRTAVWLRVGDHLQLAASWPDEEEPAVAPLPISEDELPEFPDAGRSVPVRHRSELLGALTLTKPLTEPVTPAEEKLLSDLASQAGLMLRNVRLTAELQARLVDLRASRQRLVAAQDEERRKLERNIHDGAQQQLVALAVKLRLAENLAQGEGAAKTGAMLDSLQQETADALENLRDLARGIYPPLLADKGLTAALEAQARKATVPTVVDSDGIERYPKEIEAAVYFCSLEALQNVGKYANASTATIRVAQENGHLTFEVADDGVGFDPDATGQGTGLQGMTDRMDAIDGTLEVRSAPGDGTAVTGRVPLPR